MGSKQSPTPRSRQKLTPKQRVLKKYPKAFAYEWAGPSWCVYRPHFSGNLDFGMGKTAAQAWADAARNI